MPCSAPGKRLLPACLPTFGLLTRVPRLHPCQGGDPLPALPLHPLRDGEKYYLVRGRSVDGWLAGWLFVLQLHLQLTAATGAQHGADESCPAHVECPPSPSAQPHIPLSALSRPAPLQALFLTGVYQEVMGSIHNMFGSLNTGEGRRAQVAGWARQREGCAPARVLRGRVVLSSSHPHICCSTFHTCSGGARGARPRGSCSGCGAGGGAGLRARPCP